MDCETNDCRKEKRGCDGCFYQEKHSYILNLTSREELIKCNIELLEQLEETIKENNEKDISIRMLKNELEKYKKENKMIRGITHCKNCLKKLSSNEFGFCNRCEEEMLNEKIEKEKENK